MLQIVDSPQYWNNFALHIVQTHQWGSFRLQTSTIKKIVRLESVINGRVKKIFQIFFHKIPYTPFTIAYIPRCDAPDIAELKDLKRICVQEQAIFIKLEPINSINVYSGGATPINSILPQHTIYVDLTQSEKLLLANMHSKTRYNINLAQKKGVVTKEETSLDGLEKFISLLNTTEKRQKFFSHNNEYYRLLFRSLHPHKMIHILNAYSPNNPKAIASVFLLKFKDFLYYPYGGSDYNYRSYMAPQLLHWEAIKLGKKLGCKTYDLWGSYKDSPNEKDPWWGFYRLKVGFNGKPIDFPPAIDIPLSPLYYPFILVNSVRWKVLKVLSQLRSIITIS